MKILSYPKHHLEDSEHVCVGLGHPRLSTIPNDEEGIDEAASFESFYDVGYVLGVPAFGVIQTFRFEILKLMKSDCRHHLVYQ